MDELIDAAELIVSELVGNAVKTGCQTFMVVKVRRITTTTVRISVRDGSRVLSVMVSAGPCDERHRGLALVNAMTGGHWGATAEAFGKTVHADLGHRADSDRSPRSEGTIR
ncbi:ATP-binding protein [Kitasatospora sp. NPDC058170]|uniref:ATP-binding protein n=1 Tax=Kitasatospora sp. NPDC058170 TaxID=3346364 RepID=UPI0036DA2A75